MNQNEKMSKRCVKCFESYRTTHNSMGRQNVRSTLLTLRGRTRSTVDRCGTAVAAGVTASCNCFYIHIMLNLWGTRKYILILYVYKGIKD